MAIILSPDPLMDDNPEISPYAYCHWNPMKYVDPDGKNCKLTVKENTITISAKYYSLPKDYNSVLRATALWKIVESNGFNSKNQSLWSRIKSFFE